MNRPILALALLVFFPVLLIGQDESVSDHGAETASRISVSDFDPPPGTYQESLLLELPAVFPAVEESDGRATVLEYRVFGLGESSWVPYEGAVELSALPGERREYRIGTRVRAEGQTMGETEAVYVVDRRQPAPPIIEPASGFYREPQTVAFDAPETAEVYYAVGDPEFRQWNGEAIALSGEGGLRTEYLVEAYAAFPEGGRSRVTSKKIVIDRDIVEPEEIEILSPVPGEWANPQLLYVDSAGFEEIRYSTDGSDPSGGGMLYERPVVLDVTGATTVRVVGTTISGNVLTGKVEYRAGDAELLSVQQGLRQESFEVAPPSSGAYRWGRGTGRGNSPAELFSAPVQLSVQRGSLRTSSLVVEGPYESDDTVRRYRYFFALDGRVATPPEVIVERTEDTAVVSMTGSRDAEITYRASIDGATVAEGEYDGPFDVELPRRTEDGVLEVRARSSYPGAEPSEETIHRHSFDTRPPSPPSIEASTDQAVRYVDLEPSAEDGARVHYEIAFGEEPPRPTRASPQLSGPRKGAGGRLTLPRGAASEVRMRFVAVDAAGNLSAPSRLYTVEIDRQPPSAPRISIDRGILRLQGDGELYYRVESAQIDTPEKPTRYDGPTRLSGVARRRVAYRVEAFAVDEQGNRSTAAVARHIVDRRIATVPDSLSVEDGGFYSQPEVRLQASDLPSDLVLHYTQSTNGESPPEPTTDSPVLPSEGVVFAASEGEEVPVTVKLLPRFAGSEVSGRVRSLAFTVDRRAPALPEVSGIEHEAVYADEPLVTLSPEDPRGDRIRVRLFQTGAYRGDAIEEYREAGTENEKTGALRTFRYEEPFRLRVAEGNERSFFVSVRVADRAGNVRETEQPLKVTVDRKPPALRAPRVVDQDGAEVSSTLSDGPVVLERPADDPGEPEGSIRYEIGEDGSVPGPVGHDSPVLAKPLTLSGRGGTEELIRVAYRSEDPAGNLSEETGTLSMVVDRAPPAPPEEPSVRISPDGRSARLIFAREPGLRTVYRLASDPGDRFRTVAGETMVRFPGEDLSVKVEAARVDAAGNRSAVRTFEVRGFTVNPRPILSGVTDGGIYGETVTIRNETDGATVRYEVATGGETPDAPSRFSEPLPQTLPFDVSRGETVQFTVRARSFSDDARPSEEERVSFTVDRTPPPPPELVDARSGDFYTERRTVRLTAEEGEIRYRLALVTADERESFRPYTSPVTLRAISSRLAHYQLEAYTVDQAGNRSGAPRLWDLYVDKEIVYVSDAAGEDGNGSREAPFGRISEAVDFAVRENRRTIFVSGGTFVVGAPIGVRSELSIQGGLSAENWRRSDEETTRIEAADGFRGSALFSVAGASLTLERLELTSRGGADSLIVADSAQVFLQGVHGSIESSVVGMRFTDSQLVMRRGSLMASGLTEEVALRIDGGSAELEDTKVEAARGGNRLVVLKGSGSAKITLSSSQLSAGSGRTTTVLDLEKAESRIADTELIGGPAEQTGTVLRARGGSTLLRNTTVRTNAEAGISTAASLETARFRMVGSRVVISGSRGATGISARGGRVEVSRTAFEATSAAEFMHLVSLRGSTGTVDTSIFDGGDSRELIVARLADAETRWYNNTIRSGTGSRFTQGFNVTGGSDTTLANNILFHATPGTGTAIYQTDGGAGITLTANAFAGWSTVFRQGRPDRRWERPGGDPASEVSTAAALNGRSGVNARINLDVEDQEVFSEGVHLAPGTPLIDAGVYLGDAGGPTVDWDGQQRPRPSEGNYDIGADEFFR